MKLFGNWNFPTNIRLGAGRVQELADICGQLGMRAPLVVTDPGLAGLPMLQNITDRLCADGLRTNVFFRIKANPTGANIEAGVDFYRQHQHDGVIAIGGGSGLDAAKAIALMVAQDRPIWDFEDVDDNWKRVNVAGMATTIAVPTTAGTGSEVGRASVITDELNHIKRIIFHPRMLPHTVVLDPELTLGLPAALTAATGMDALSHNLEALCSPTYHPMAQGIALEAIRLVKNHLCRAVADGTDITARTQMLVVSSMGATAFQKGLGAMHALSHPLGALYDAHHGTLNAVLMPYVLHANRAAIAEPIALACRCMGLKGSSVDHFIDWVVQLRQEIRIPHTLKELDINTDLAGRIALMATQDPSAGGNPVQFTAAEYQQIFIAAVNGEL